MTPPYALLRDAIEAVAELDPDRVALAGGGETRTYGQLVLLLGEGASPSDRRRAVTVSPRVADVETVLRRSFLGDSLLLLDAKATAAERERAEALFAEPGAVAAEDPRQCIGLVTSGSGGLPKLVELDWESLLLNARSFAAAAAYGAEDVVWCTTPLAHLFCFGTGMLAGLLSGATVLLTDGVLGPVEFAAAARGERATVLLSVPFLFRRYLEILRGEPGLAKAWSIRSCIAAGEPVRPDLIDAWRQLSGVRLRSHFGLTEGGHLTLASGEAEEGVGAPLADVELRVADGAIQVRRRAPQRPYRVVGETPDAAGWCDTGDLGYLDEDGNLHVTGRAGQRINFAGKKIDPGEVEQALLACEGVADCAVAGVEGADGERVAAFIRVAEDATVSDGQIRAHLASRLSPYKLPRHFVRVEEVPRTLTGKVRRGELIAEFAGAEGGGDWDDALELVRAEAAATVLGHSSPEAIDPETSFKDLGFDSLAGVELRNRLAEATGLRLASTLVFDHPSAEAVAKFLRAELEGARSAPADTDRKLDTIAGILASISVEERDRAAVRLKLLLADLAPATRLGGDEYDEVDFESASDEELLQLIDKELGRC